MTEFVNNNAILLLTEQLTFFLNKDFHSRMSFDLNLIKYKIIRVRIKVNKAKDIFKYMKRSLILIK